MCKTSTSNMPDSSPTIPTPIRDCMVYGPKGKPEEPKTEGSTKEDIFPRAKLNNEEDEPNPYYITITQPDRYVETLLDMDFRYAGINAT